MPLLGAIGNSSEYSFRGNYDDISNIVNFPDYINVPLESVYTTHQQIVSEINYKILIETLSGVAKILISDEDIKIPTLDSIIVTSDEDVFTFDSNITALNYVGLTTTSVIARPNDRFILVLEPLSGAVESSIDQYNNIIRVGGEEITWNVSIDRIPIAQNLTFSPVSVSVLNALSGSAVTSTPYVVEGLANDVSYTAEILSQDGFLNVNSGGNVKLSPVFNGDVLTLNVVPTLQSNGVREVTLAIYSSGSVGLAQTTWSVRTLQYAPDLNNFFFNNVLDAELTSEVITEPRLITGMVDENSRLLVGYNIFGQLVVPNSYFSINNSEYILSNSSDGVQILNNSIVRLKITTSNVWEEQINVPVFIGIIYTDGQGNFALSGEFTTWILKNRAIRINLDDFSTSLLFALPLETKYGISDISPEVRTFNNQATGFRSTIIPQGSPIISSERSKFYFSSGKFTNGNIVVQTNPNDLLRSSNFTFSAFIFVSSFNFGGDPGPYIVYSSYGDTLNLSDFGFSIRIKGDSWSADQNLRRGIAVSLPILGSNGENIILETRQQVLLPNTFHNIVLTRNNNVFKLYVDGVNVGRTVTGANSISILSDLTGNNYRLGYSPQPITEDYYIQDAKLYKGNDLYPDLNFFSVDTQVTSILEKRID